MMESFATVTRIRTERLRLGGEAWFLISAALLCTVALTVLAQPRYWAEPRLAAPALTIDLSVGLSLLGYVFLVRGRQRRGWMVVVPLFVVGLMLARWWIPEAHQHSSGAFRLLLAGSEVVLLGYLALRGRSLVAAYRTLLGTGRSRADSARHALTRVLGDRLGGALFTEFSALWYASQVRRSEPAEGPGVKHFAGHRRNGYPAVLGVVLLMIFVESSVAHLVLAPWTPVAAWISTALGVYSGIWLLGDYQAARLNPTTVGRDALVLNVGLRWQATVGWSEIAAIHDHKPEGESQSVTMFGAADLWIELSSPVKLLGPFGIVRTTRRLGVGVDAAADFRDAIEKRMSGVPM